MNSNPLSQAVQQEQLEQLQQQELDVDFNLELEFERSVDDDVSDLTFDRSAFDSSVYTHGHRDRERDRERGRDRDVDFGAEYGGVELSEQNVRRFGARRGYAPALNEDSESDATSVSSQGDVRRPRRPLSRKELMIRNFTRRVQEASTFDSRFYNSSTLILIAQVVIMVLMIREGGIVPFRENVMIGPDVHVLLDYGAQQGGYIIYEHQWWRLASAMFVHAGVIHLVCNAYVQVCGFLSALWGRFTWLLIYFTSGIFGNIMSVIESPDAVAVGSSGGLMGVLSAWAMFIILTWGLVPESQRSARNSQLCTLIVNIIIVVIIGQLDFVDGAAHLGGMIQGSLLGLFLLSDEQDNINIKWFVRTLSLGGIIVLYIWAFAVAWNKVEPSEERLLEYE